jgi:phospholipid transport system transporter-binding protein
MSEMQERVLRLDGALTVDSVAAHLATGRRLAAEHSLVVDFSGVTESDSGALALVLDWLRVSAAAGKQLSLNAVPDNLFSLAELYGVAELLPPRGVAESV